MKKLSLIAGLACLATVGGVFGTWVFGTQGATSASQEAAITTTVDADVKTHGALEATKTGGLTGLHFDQHDVNVKDAKVSAKAGSTDYVVSYTDTTEYAEEEHPSYTCVATLTITPVDGEEEDLTDYGVQASTVIAAKADTTWTYEVSTILAALDPTTPINNAAEVAAFNAAVANSTIKITFVVSVNLA